MEGRGASVQKFLYKLRNGRTGSPVFREGRHLFLRRDFTGDEEPKQGFRKGF